MKLLNERRSLKMFAILLLLIPTLISCRHRQTEPPVRTIGQAGCEWVAPIYLTDETKTLLLVNASSPNVRADVKKIADHNRLYEQFCK